MSILLGLNLLAIRLLCAIILINNIGRAIDGFLSLLSYLLYILNLIFNDSVYLVGLLQELLAILFSQFKIRVIKR